jgi:NTE family protein
LPRITFVLSGGGALGAIQVGMLRALIDAGVRPDLVVGSSVGAINGAAVAADPTVSGIERLERLWTGIAAGDPELMPTRGRVLTQMARRGEAVHDPAPLRNLLEDALPVETFEALPVSFTCVATDLETTSEHWFDRGRLVPALMASAALPVIYPAVQLADRTFIDGGVVRELPVKRAVELGATELYVLHVNHLDRRSLEVRRPGDAILRAYWTARRHRVEEELSEVPDDLVVHRLPSGDQPRIRFDNFSQSMEMAEVARVASSAYLRRAATGSDSDGGSQTVDPGARPDEDTAWQM